MIIAPIQDVARQRRLLFTEHTIRQMIKRQITDEEVRDAILSGEIHRRLPGGQLQPQLPCAGQDTDRSPVARTMLGATSR